MTLRGTIRRLLSSRGGRSWNESADVAEALRHRFEELGPWFTQFEVEGQQLGGANSYESDYRVDLFFQWMGEPKSILELSSFEGGHTVRLARPSHVTRVLGLEGRVENIARARLAMEVLGVDKVEFREVDLDTETLKQFGRFDAVFCAGLLYHLTEPWRLLAEIASVTDRLFLDTHYSATEEAQAGNWLGRWYDGEGGYGDVLSGLSPASFWMSLPSLVACLGEHGFNVRNRQIVDDWAGAGPRVHLAAIRDGST
jgi:SAM-dependent methyltransferase